MSRLTSPIARVLRQGRERAIELARRGMARARTFGAGTLALVAWVAILFGAYFWLLSTIAPVQSGSEMSLDRLRITGSAGRVASAVVHDEDGRIVIKRMDGRTFWTAYPRSDAQTAQLIDELVAGGAKVTVDQQAEKARTRFIAQFLMPLVILASLFGLFFMLMSRRTGMAEFTAFSKFTGKKSPSAHVTFADVAACREAIIELEEVVDYLRRPERFAALGALAPKGVLLCGPPGTGKTLLARAVAGEAEVPFFSLSGSEFVESLVGVGAARVRDLFRQARETAPAIIFIDELDAAGRQRGAGMGQGNDEREQTLNQLLVEMDGFSATQGIVVMAATNRPDILDPALMRPGRFDRQVVVDAPDIAGRAEILRLHVLGRPLDGDVDIDRIAGQCPGFTGADIANLVNEASLLAVREGANRVCMAHLEEAIERVIAGPERRSHVLTVDERRLVAYHEAGHAVAVAGAGGGVGMQKLSIVARGRSLGHASRDASADRLVHSRSDLRRQIVGLLGGVAAEQEVFGETTTGSEGDLRTATEIARAMVATYGMGTVLGRVTLGQRSGEVFLGRDFTQVSQVSPATMKVVDDEIRAILEDAEREAAQLVRQNRSIVETIVTRLLAVETLSGPDLDALLGKVRPAKRLVPSSSSGNGHRTRRPVIKI